MQPGTLKAFQWAGTAGFVAFIFRLVLEPSPNSFVLGVAFGNGIIAGIIFFGLSKVIDAWTEDGN